MTQILLDGVEGSFQIRHQGFFQLWRHPIDFIHRPFLRTVNVQAVFSVTALQRFLVAIHQCVFEHSVILLFTDLGIVQAGEEVLE